MLAKAEGRWCPGPKRILISLSRPQKQGISTLTSKLWWGLRRFSFQHECWSAGIYCIRPPLGKHHSGPPPRNWKLLCRKLVPTQEIQKNGRKWHCWLVLLICVISTLAINILYFIAWFSSSLFHLISDLFCSNTDKLHFDSTWEKEAPMDKM